MSDNKPKPQDSKKETKTEKEEKTKKDKEDVIEAVINILLL